MLHLIFFWSVYVRKYYGDITILKQTQLLDLHCPFHPFCSPKLWLGEMFKNNHHSSPQADKSAPYNPFTGISVSFQIVCTKLGDLSCLSCPTKAPSISLICKKKRHKKNPPWKIQCHQAGW